MAMTILIWLVLTATDYQVKAVDPAINLLVIELAEPMYNGSDGACKIAIQTVAQLTKHGFVVYVMNPDSNGFVPSRINPMTDTWTQYILADNSNY